MTPATVAQAVILVGGSGSRLGRLTADTPKPLLPIGDRPMLAWLLRELCRYGVERVLLLAGHLAERVQAALPALLASLPRPLDVAVLTEPVPAGTGGALWHARDRLEARFWLLNGDSLFDTNLARLLAAAAADPPDVLARLLLHRLPEAGRYGMVTTEDERVVAFADRPPAGAAGPTAINAGIAVVSAEIVEHCSASCSLERDVLPRLAVAGALRATTAEGWFIDIGISDDFARAQTELPRRLRRPALILDRDGVLNVDHGYVGSADRLHWMPAAAAAVRAACDRGWHVFVATNQSGVARGYYDEAAVQALHAHMAEALHRSGGTIDDWRYCPHHPDGTVAAFALAHPWRKPQPGMLHDLIAAWQLDASRCVMLGDQPSDLAAAAAAGIEGVRFAGGDLHASVTILLDRRATAAA